MYGVESMAVSYKKLRKIQIDKDMKKKNLCVAARISHASMAKLARTKMSQQMCWRSFVQHFNVI